jgi:hypothetical protein
LSKKGFHKRRDKILVMIKVFVNKP